MARVDGNGLGGKRRRRIDHGGCFTAVQLGLHQLTPRTEFEEQTLVARTAETGKWGTHRLLSLSESLRQGVLIGQLTDRRIRRLL